MGNCFQQDQEHTQQTYTQPILHHINHLSCFTKIALKLPHGTKGVFYEDDKKTFEPCDVNEWIRSLYQSAKWTGWVVYNDETSLLGNKTTKKGHCKGIMAWNDKHMSWLIHSVPNFPREFTGHSISPIEPSEHVFGQSFLYVTRPCDEAFLKQVLGQIYHMNSHIYLRSNEPTYRFTEAKHSNQIQTLVFSDLLVHHAKSPHHEIDIYSDYLVGLEEGDWFVETWKRGSLIKKRCGKTNDVCLVNVHGTEYKESQDHSKWAISTSYYWIGDLNRMQSQFKRGGGGMLVKQKEVAKAFRSFIIKIESHLV
jgi:deoxyribonuclease-2